jgi:hypothetical protein
MKYLFSPLNYYSFTHHALRNYHLSHSISLNYHFLKEKKKKG